MSLVNAGHRRISSSTCFVLICSYQLSATADPSVYDTAGVNADSLDKLVQLYNETPTALLDVHAPVVSRTARLRPRTNPWFDNHCREAKKRARSLERRYKRHGSDCNSRGKWTNALRDSHKLGNIADTAQLVRQAPMKQCSIDPLPIWLLKDCIDLLAPFYTHPSIV